MNHSIRGGARGFLSGLMSSLIIFGAFPAESAKAACPLSNQPGWLPNSTQLFSQPFSGQEENQILAAMSNWEANNSGTTVNGPGNCSAVFFAASI
jgi:hypothetical protein